MPGNPELQLMTELARLLRSLGKVVGTHLQANLQSSELTPPQMWALQHLESPCPMGTLGERLGIDKSYVTAIADSLEQSGLVERRPDTTDRRVRNLVLTDRGRALRVRFEAEMLHTLPIGHDLSEQELRQLIDLLAKALPRPVEGDHRDA